MRCAAAAWRCNESLIELSHHETTKPLRRDILNLRRNNKLSTTSPCPVKREQKSSGRDAAGRAGYDWIVCRPGESLRKFRLHLLISSLFHVRGSGCKVRSSLVPCGKFSTVGHVDFLFAFSSSRYVRIRYASRCWHYNCYFYWSSLLIIIKLVRLKITIKRLNYCLRVLRQYLYHSTPVLLWSNVGTWTRMVLRTVLSRLCQRLSGPFKHQHRHRRNQVTEEIDGKKTWIHIYSGSSDTFIIS